MFNGKSRRKKRRDGGERERKKKRKKGEKREVAHCDKGQIQGESEAIEISA